VNIKQSVFREFIPTEKLNGLNFWTAHGIVKKYFCGPLTAHNLCPQKCDECRARILGVFRLDDAKNPAALLTWILRDEVAKIRDENLSKGYTPKTDPLGVPMPESNPFAALAEQYEERK